MLIQLSIIKKEVITTFYSVSNNLFVQLTLFFWLGILASYIFYLIYRLTRRRRQEKFGLKMKLKAEQERIDQFLKTNLRELEANKLKSKLRRVNKSLLIEKYPALKNKIKEAKNVLVELKHKSEMNQIINKKIHLREDVEQLRKEKEELERKDDSKRASVEYNLELDKNPVFDKSKLTKTEIEVLLKRGYTQTNEYCVAKRGIITILIKPILKHSVAHTFLVWSTRQLLEQYGVIKNIKEHETRDADITFEVDEKVFAIEIETGSLLRKKKQLDEKIIYLNKKYGKRWIIIVSNRNLVKKYKRFGMCIQRKQVLKKLEKMINF
jgi:type II secretory pathway component PulJ